MAPSPEGYEGPLKWMWWNGKQIPYNPSLGVTVKWINHIKGRITKKLSTKIIVVGEAGISKTYSGTAISMLFDNRFKITPPPSQVIFGHKDYLDLTLELPSGRWIVLDEPSYVIGKREWYEELNKILVKSIESDRYKVHPLVIPIISKDLLDKTVREHLIQFMVIMYDIGKGSVYRITRDHFNDKVLYHYVCELITLQPKRELWGECHRLSCLDCPELATCNKFIWPQYERLRDEIQTKRYKQGRREIEMKERRKLTFRDKIRQAKEKKKKLVDEEGEYDITRIMLEFRCSQASAYRLKSALELDEEEPIDLDDSQ